MFLSIGDIDRGCEIDLHRDTQEILKDGDLFPIPTTNKCMSKSKSMEELFYIVTLNPPYFDEIPQNMNPFLQYTTKLNYDEEDFMMI